MIKQFNLIKQEYDNFYKSLLRQGKVPVRDTEKGIWGTAIADNVFNFFKKIRLSKYKKFIDLGSGDGKVVLIASLFTDATGIEFDKELHKKALEIKNKLKLKAKFMKEDYLKVDLSKYDIIFINPDKGFHKGVEDKLLKELKGKLFVYNNIFLPRFLKKGKSYWFDETPVISYTRT